MVNCSSARMATTLSAKSDNGRKVYFADSIGHSLVAIKTITPNSSSEDLRSDCKHKRSAQQRLKNGIHTTCQVMLPAARCSGFNHVTLDNLRCSSNAITGYVRVVNLAYEKSVTVRYTEDEWNTFKDIPADYVFSVSQDRTDIFVFTIFLQKNREAPIVEFAVRYKTKGREYWDNNNNMNYRIDMRKYKKHWLLGEWIYTPHKNIPEEKHYQFPVYIY